MGSDIVLPTECIVCTDVLVDPITLRCHESHVFCRECLLSVRQSLCPICRAPFSQYDDVWNAASPPCVNDTLESLMRTTDKYRLMYYNTISEQAIMIQLEHMATLLCEKAKLFTNSVEEINFEHLTNVPLQFLEIVQKFLNDVERAVRIELPAAMDDALKNTRWEYLHTSNTSPKDFEAYTKSHVDQLFNIETACANTNCSICYETITKRCELVTLPCCGDTTPYCIKCLLVQPVPKCIRCHQLTYHYQAIEDTYQLMFPELTVPGSWFKEYVELDQNPLHRKCQMQHFFDTMDRYEPNAASKPPRMRYSHILALTSDLMQIETRIHECANNATEQLNFIKLLIDYFVNNPVVSESEPNINKIF